MDKSATFSGDADEALRALVRATPPFDGLPEEVLRKLCGRMTRVRVPAGQDLCARNDRSDAMHIVLAGRAHAVDDSQGAARSATEDIGPGKLIGEIQFLVGAGARRRSARASTASSRASRNPTWRRSRSIRRSSSPRWAITSAGACGMSSCSAF